MWKQGVKVNRCLEEPYMAFRVERLRQLRELRRFSESEITIGAVTDSPSNTPILSIIPLILDRMLGRSTCPPDSSRVSRRGGNFGG